jgi:hypothetical protein
MRSKSTRKSTSSLMPVSEKPLFSNCLILDPKGSPLSRCPGWRANRYLEHGSAIDVTPKDENGKPRDGHRVLQLTFEPSGRRGCDDPIVIGAKPNHCVVCRAEKNLTRHHVVPTSVLFLIPTELKAKNPHDVLPLCDVCHCRYERSMQWRMETLLRINGVFKLYQEALKKFVDFTWARDWCKTFLKYEDRIPKDRCEDRHAKLAKILGYMPSREEMEKIRNWSDRKDFPMSSPGEFLRGKIDDPKAFIKGWRAHFIEVMQPKFLPEGWRIDWRLDA